MRPGPTKRATGKSPESRPAGLESLRYVLAETEAVVEKLFYRQFQDSLKPALVRTLKDGK